ncbi:MAG: hypothetical protein ACR2PZ_04460, partial [Pseudomonadales bacterium]
MTQSEEILAWVKAACPERIRGSALEYSGGHKQPISNAAFQSWFDACVERGMTVPDWPEQFGGAGLDTQGALAFRNAL